MSNFAWIASILVAALFFWALGSVLKHRFLSVDESAVNILKVMLQHRDIDPAGIPDAALIDIILATIDEAKDVAGRRPLPSHADENWRRHLIRLLDSKANEIEQVLRNGPDNETASIVSSCLLKYGVVLPPSAPPMSAEEFSDATRSGTLFAALEERLSARWSA